MTTVTAKKKRIAVIGGGPIGLEAAWHGRMSGFEVDLYERADIAAHVRDWGHVRLFSPFGMNSSHRGRQAILKHNPHSPLPEEGEFLTGRDYADRYLIPLSRLPQLAGSIHEGTFVRGVSRSRHWKGDLIGQAARGHDPFQLLLESADGSQHARSADFVLDCSGVYSHHNWLGAGGLPAVGEIAAEQQIEYHLPDILGTDRARYAGQTTLVVGGGYSAATAIGALAELGKSHPGTRVFWLTRAKRHPPLPEIENDPLPERASLTRRVNQLADSEPRIIHLLSHRIIESVAHNGGQGGFQVRFRSADHDGEAEKLHADRLMANVGYHPDHTLYENLQIHICYATSGPIKLAATLLGESSVDCLKQSSTTAESLRNPEPGFFILGAKSYGRDSRFLIRRGLQQIEDVFSLMAGDLSAS